jgi:hypothetical protein
MDYFTAQKRIAILWFTMGGFLILMLITMILFGKFEDKSGEAWGWFLPTILPTFSLITCVFIHDFNNSAVKSMQIKRFYFYLSFFLSLSYIIVLYLIICSPLYSSNTILENMKTSNIFLGAIQTVVTASLGLFFVSKN